MSDSVKQIETCYENYTKIVQKVLADAKPVDGLLGLGDDPSKHPCHEAFYYEVEALVKGISETEKDPAVLAQIVTYMLRAEIIWKDCEDAVWMIIAASGHSVMLIPGLLPQDAKMIMKLYGDIAPRFMRLPVQKKIAAALKEAARKKA